MVLGLLIICICNTVAVVALAVRLYFHTSDEHIHPDEETTQPESEAYGHPNGSKHLTLGQWVREGG